MAAALKPCVIAECNNLAGYPGTARGMCRSHYRRWHRHGDPLLGGTPMNARPRWIEAHKDHAGDECLLWPFSRTDSGYGQFKIKGRSTLASHAMCVAAHGPQPTPEHQAAHRCGNGSGGCVNPRHLYWATPAENSADALMHGTRARGERQGMAKLTEDDVRSIRALAGVNTEVEISQRYGVSRSQVGRIIRRERWAWLD